MRRRCVPHQVRLARVLQARGTAPMPDGFTHTRSLDTVGEGGTHPHAVKALVDYRPTLHLKVKVNTAHQGLW